MKKKFFSFASLIMLTCIFAACGKSTNSTPVSSSALTNPIPLGASLILDADTITGATSPTGSCSVTSWTDSSGLGNNGTINCAAGGGFSGSGTPADPHAIVFNGTSTSVTTLLNAQPNTMPNSTWMVWIKPAAVTSQQILSIDNHSGAFNRSLVIDSITKNFGVFNPFNPTFTTEPVSVGTWQFVAVTFTPTDISFISNSSGGSSVSLGVAPNYTPTTQKFTIGRSAGGAFNFLNGAIAWVAVYPRALAIGEITDTCNALVARFDGILCDFSSQQFRKK